MKPPWYLQRSLLLRSKEIVAAFSRHGAGWLIGRLGLEKALPLERGWLGPAARKSPYSRPEHVRLAMANLGVVFFKLG
jgi:ubiquinone biosynthesis protein